MAASDSTHFEPSNYHLNRGHRFFFRHFVVLVCMKKVKAGEKVGVLFNPFDRFESFFELMYVVRGEMGWWVMSKKNCCPRFAVGGRSPVWASTVRPNFELWQWWWWSYRTLYEHFPIFYYSNLQPPLRYSTRPLASSPLLAKLFLPSH